MRVALWGAGGHGRVVLDAIRQSKLYEPIAFVDDSYNQTGDGKTLELPVIHGRDSLRRLRADGVGGMIITIGDELKRTELAGVAVKAGFRLCTIIHPAAVVCHDVQIGAGTVVFAGAVVQTGCDVGENVIVNTCVSIDHDCRIGDGAQLAPRVVMGGRVSVGEISFIGIGSTVINRITVGRNCVIGAGAVVVRDIPNHSHAYGVPARVVRQRKPL